jgi:glycine cleavage system H protein
MLFNKSHEWVKVDNDIATIGISDYAQSQLGDIVFIELPQIGQKLERFSQLGTIESTKSASEICSPLTGEVVEVNDELVNNPQWINESPFEKGWMVKVKISDPNETSSLLDDASYRELVAKESH